MAAALTPRTRAPQLGEAFGKSHILVAGIARLGGFRGVVRGKL